MTYVLAGRRRPLGDISTSALLGAGANAIVPGSGAIVGTVAGLASTLLGNGSVDKQRADRANWFGNAAVQGSPLAARLVLDAQSQVSANEWQHQWQLWVTQIPQAVRDAAAALPMAWPVGGGDFNMTAQKNAVLAQLNALHTAAPASSSSSSLTMPSSGYLPPSMSPRPTMLPGMVTTAPFNWTPLLLGSGILAAALLLAQLTGGRGRRRR